jgi:hypothetical protein
MCIIVYVTSAFKGKKGVFHLEVFLCEDWSFVDEAIEFTGKDFEISMAKSQNNSAGKGSNNRIVRSPRSVYPQSIYCAIFLSIIAFLALPSFYVFSPLLLSMFVISLAYGIRYIIH